jgi:DNA-binding GntR family transcriptional regulator
LPPSAGKDIAETIYAKLRTEILDLSIMPGQEMSESSICERFNASRTPVHVALRRLADKGLIEFVPYKGVRASLLRFDDIRQMIHMRCILETDTIEHFIDIADPYSIEDCIHNLRKQQIMLSSPDFTPPAFFSQDSLLHQTWFVRAGIPKIWEGIQDSEVYYTRFRMLDIVEMHQFREIVSEHEQLLELVREGKKEPVRQLITHHLFGGIRRMSDKLGNEFAPYFEDFEYMKGFLETADNLGRSRN